MRSGYVAVSLGLDEPRRIDEPAHLDERARGPDLAEHLAVGARGLAPALDVDEHDARADHVRRRPAGLGDRADHDLEAALRLRVDIAGVRGGPIRPDRRGAGDGDPRPERTARENPIVGSKGDPDETRWWGMPAMVVARRGRRMAAAREPPQLSQSR